MPKTLSEQLMALEDEILGPADHGISPPTTGMGIIPDDSPTGTCSYEEIAALAYQLWNNRGCPVGSPEEDWWRAERWLRTKGALPSGPPSSQ
jgi:hypothetical protein